MNTCEDSKRAHGYCGGMDTMTVPLTQTAVPILLELLALCSVGSAAASVWAGVTPEASCGLSELRTPAATGTRNPPLGPTPAGNQNSACNQDEIGSISFPLGHSGETQSQPKPWAHES